MLKRLLNLAILAALAINPAYADDKEKPSCGGDFKKFVKGLKDEALDKGFDKKLINHFFSNVEYDKSVIRADRAQGVFQLPFLDFSKRLISKHRLNKGIKNSKKYDEVFTRIEQEYGVSRGVLLAFWAFETDFGAVQGNFNTLNALTTLAHDCRRPELFRPQVFAALKLYERGDFDPVSTKGAWAGEIGMVQMLPEDILHNGVDGDSDGKVSLKSSAPDALMSGAKMLHELGWQANQPWIQQIQLPKDMDYTLTGLRTQKSVKEWEALGITGKHKSLPTTGLSASVLLPQGHKGPAFLIYPNFKVFLEWNESLVYITTAAYFATILEGEPKLTVKNPASGLSGNMMKHLQRKLVDLGYDVGKVDGILGAKTRAAVQEMQHKLGLSADAWPTMEFLDKL